MSMRLLLSSSSDQQERAHAHTVALRTVGHGVFDVQDPLCYKLGPPSAPTGHQERRAALDASDALILLLPADACAHGLWGLAQGLGKRTLIAGVPAPGEWALSEWGGTMVDDEEIPHVLTEWEDQPSDSALLTFGGRFFDPLRPRQELLDVVELAHALARLCRWGGHVHCLHFSVAQHCLITSYIVPDELRLCALLHDAPEACGLGDIRSPVKRQAPQLGAIEARIWIEVAERFGLPKLLPSAVLQADHHALATEARDLMGEAGAAWGAAQLPQMALPLKLQPLPVAQAERLWLLRFLELTRGLALPRLERARCWLRARRGLMATGAELSARGLRFLSAPA